MKYIYYRNKIPRLENFKLKQVIDNDKDVEAIIYKVNQFSERERYVKGFRTLVTMKKCQKFDFSHILCKRFSILMFRNKEKQQIADEMALKASVFKK